jgi:hypothetical protein
VVLDDCRGVMVEKLACFELEKHAPMKTVHPNLSFLWLCSRQKCLIRIQVLKLWKVTLIWR